MDDTRFAALALLFSGEDDPPIVAGGGAKGRDAATLRQLRPQQDGEARSSAEHLIEAAARQAQLNGAPAPSEAVLAATREVYRELTAEGLDASDITHDALGGIAITIGNAAAFAWVSLRNDAPATVRFLGERGGGPPIPVTSEFAKRVAKHVRSPPTPKR